MKPTLTALYYLTRPLCIIVTMTAVLWGSQVQAGFIYDQVLPKDPNRSKSDDRRYALYIPSYYDNKKAMPLVVAMHGCLQTDRTIADKSRFEEIAENKGFIVLYPYIGDNASNGNDQGGTRCWQFFVADEIHRDNGEVGDIARLVDHVKSKYKIDQNRIHILGVSSGGAMTTASIVAYPDVFASGAILDGVGYAETAAVFTGAIPDCNMVLNKNLGNVRPTADVVKDMRAEMAKTVLRQTPVMVMHNKKDCTVPFKVGRAIVEAFAGLMAKEGQAIDINTPQSTTSGTTGHIPWVHNKYGEGVSGGSLIETVDLDAYWADLVRNEEPVTNNPYVPGSQTKDRERGHAWFGAKRGPWVLTGGPFTAEVAWDFFTNHPYNHIGPTISCNHPVVSGKSIILNCSAKGVYPITSYHVVITGPSPKDETLPGGPNLSKQYDNLADGMYTVTVSAADDQGKATAPDTKNVSIPSDQFVCFTETNGAHVAAGRAHRCYLLLYCANGSENMLGFFGGSITSLKQTELNTWTKVDQCQ